MIESAHHLIQVEEGGHDRDRAQHVERHVGEGPRLVEAAEGAEEVPIPRGREGHAGVAEQEREDRAESSPEDHHGHDEGRATAVDPLHELRDHELGRKHLPPGQDAQEREVQQEVRERTAEDGVEDRAGYDSPGIPDLVPDVADVVVAQVVVDGDQGGAPQPEHEAAVEVESPRRKVERPRGVEARQPGGDDGDQGHDRPHPERDRDPAQERDPPREDEDGQDAHAGGDEALPSPDETRPEVGRILTEADQAGGDLERTAEDEGPDEQERHQPTPPIPAVGLAQETIAPSRAGPRGPELAPHLPVAHHDEGADQPAQEGLGSAHGRHQQGDGDEWARPRPCSTC